MTYTPLECLRDIVREAELADQFVMGMTYDQFVGDEKTVHAVVRARHTDVPWRNITGMRDRLIHSYREVNYRIVWGAVRDELPKIRPVLENLIKEIEP